MAVEPGGNNVMIAEEAVQDLPVPGDLRSRHDIKILYIQDIIVLYMKLQRNAKAKKLALFDLNMYCIFTYCIKINFL